MTNTCPNIIGRSLLTHESMACGRKILPGRRMCISCELWTTRKEVNRMEQPETSPPETPDAPDQAPEGDVVEGDKVEGDKTDNDAG